MAQGMTNVGIADTLHLSRSSVEKYSTSIFQKLGLNRDDTHVHRRVSAVPTLLHTKGLARSPDPRGTSPPLSG